MKPAPAVLGLVLLATACSKPTELASEANARYDKRDAVVAAPPPDAEIDVTPVDPEPGTPEADLSAPPDFEPTSDDIEQLPLPAAEPSPSPAPVEPAPPASDQLDPTEEPPVVPPPSEPAPG